MMATGIRASRSPNANAERIGAIIGSGIGGIRGIEETTLTS
jgi:3-oxoacyl-(acyl-carrier-protein) synthase